MRENRSTFLMCSCTALEHGLRGGRILDLQRRTGVCSDVGNKTGNIRDVRTPRVASYQYAARSSSQIKYPEPPPILDLWSFVERFSKKLETFNPRN